MPCTCQAGPHVASTCNDKAGRDRPPATLPNNSAAVSTRLSHAQRPGSVAGAGGPREGAADAVERRPGRAAGAEGDSRRAAGVGGPWEGRVDAGERRPGWFTAEEDGRWRASGACGPWRATQEGSGPGGAVVDGLGQGRAGDCTCTRRGVQEGREERSTLDRHRAPGINVDVDAVLSCALDVQEPC